MPETTTARPQLTQREEQFLAWYAAGWTQNQIARELWLSLDAVKSATRTLNRKLGATNLPNAVALGYQHGFLPRT